jgi:zinc protease
MLRTALLAFAAVLLPAPAVAQTAGTVSLDFTEEVLPNGLRVVYHVDHATPVAASVLWYDVGSKHEEPGRTGFAHLFEHLMLFTGSRNVPEGQAFALLEAAGGRAGPDLNGTTSADRTNYFQQVPSHMLELALWVEADRMATLDEVLNQVKLDNQREVVRNERRQGVDNQPHGLWVERMLATIFPSGHPYHHTVIGSLEDLGNASLEDVRAFFRRYYVPNNAVLIVAGDIDLDATRQMVRRYFGPIPRGADPPPLRDASLPPRLGAAPREVIEDANAPAPAVYIGYRMPSARDPRHAQVALLGPVLAGGRSSPLFQSLVRERQIATNVFATSFGFLEGADLFVVGVTGLPGASPDSLEAAVLEELRNATRHIDVVGLERARASARFAFVNQLQSLGGFGGRGDMLAQGAVFHGDAGWINRRISQISAVDVQALHELARERMTDDNRAILVFVPAPRTGTDGDGGVR